MRETKEYFVKFYNLPPDLNTSKMSHSSRDSKTLSFGIDESSVVIVPNDN